MKKTIFIFSIFLFSSPTHAALPDFGQNPTVVSRRDGDWNDRTMWSTNAVPGQGAVVNILHTVKYNLTTSPRLTTVSVRPGGKLWFPSDANTKMLVVNFTVLEGGRLEIGTSALPIRADKTVDIVFADVAPNTTLDPEQFGTGFIGMGEITIYGAPKNTFIRLSQEPAIGDHTLSLAETADGWRANDRVVVPDTRQLNPLAGEIWDHYQIRWEDLKLQSAGGMSATLSTGLQYAHKGARNGDGVVELLPHLGNLTRNVIFESENPNGIRGHFLCMGKATVDIEYAQFENMGRSNLGPVDDTTFDTSGNVNHVGTNQSYRHALCMLSLRGPENPSNTGYQFKLIGNAVVDFNKWGLVLADSHFGLIQRNVVFNGFGAGIVGATANVSYNLFENNFVVGTQGHGTGRINDGREGSSYWFRGFNNYLRNNVASDAVGLDQGIVSGTGFNMQGEAAHCSWCAPTPLFRGANTSGQENVDFKYIDMYYVVPLLEFSGNETYGATSTGLALWGHNQADGGESLVKNFTVWHVYEEAYFGYPARHVTFDHWVIRGDASVGGVNGYSSGDYTATDITIRNANIQGVSVGIVQASALQGTFKVEDSYIRPLDAGIGVTYIQTPGSGGANGYGPITHLFRNVKMDAWPGRALTTIYMHYPVFPESLGGNYMQKNETYVIDYLGHPGENFRIYFNEQKGDFKPRASNPGPGSGEVLVGTPFGAEGLTNQQLVDRFPDGADIVGQHYNPVAMAGSIAPCNALPDCPNRKPYSEINGLVFPADLPPVLAINSPHSGETTGSNVTVHYSHFGNMTGVDHVHFKLDNAAEVRDLDFDGIYLFTNVTPGPHTLMGYLATANHAEVPGTRVSVSFTSILNESPNVNAGLDQTISITSQAHLMGSATDDGVPNPPGTLTKTWSKVSGLGNVTFTNAASAETFAHFSAAGTYVLRLTASDSQLTATDDVTITVSAGSAGSGPITSGGFSRAFNPMKNEKANVPCSKDFADVRSRAGTVVNRLNCSNNAAEWDGRNNQGIICPSGLYAIEKEKVVLKK